MLMFVIRGNEVYMGVVLSNYLLMKTQKNFSLLQIYFCKILIISILSGISQTSLYLSKLYQ